MSGSKIVKKKFKNMKIKPMVGFEFEFYILNEKGVPIEQTQFFDEISEIMKLNEFNGHVLKEIELGQIEIASDPTFDIENLFMTWNNTLNDLKSFFRGKNLELNHQSKPFIDKSGNGMHINISLHDIITNENLFGKEIFESKFEYNNITKSPLMNYSIAGILDHIRNNIKLYIQNDSMLDRIKNFDRNTPTNISWGKNNRTTLIRIPESDLKSKRIEVRISSSEDDLEKLVCLLLDNIIYGIYREFPLQDCTYGLAFNNCYSDLCSLVGLYCNTCVF